MLRQYEIGKASVSFGSLVVNGLGTSWLTYICAGDILHVGEDAGVIGSVDDIGAITLTETWAGATVTRGAYWIEIAPDNLTRAKTTKRNEINRERAWRCTWNVAALGYVWQADMASQDLLNKAIMLASNGLPLPSVWRTVDNYDMPITSINDLLAIAGAIGVQTQTAYSTSWTLKAQVDAATTVEEVAAVVWS